MTETLEQLSALEQWVILEHSILLLNRSLKIYQGIKVEQKNSFRTIIIPTKDLEKNIKKIDDVLSEFLERAQQGLNNTKERVNNNLPQQNESQYNH